MKNHIDNGQKDAFEQLSVAFETLSFFFQRKSATTFF